MPCNPFRDLDLPRFFSLCTEQDRICAGCVYSTGDVRVESQESHAWKHSADLYRQALQAMPSHTVVLDRTGRIAVVNEAWEAFARANSAALPAVLAGANYLDVCRKAATNDEGARQALIGIEDVLHGKLPWFDMEYPCHSSKEQRWFQMSVRPLGAPAPHGVIVIHHDVTAWRRSEDGLRESEMRFRAAFDCAAVGIGEIAVDGRWRNANQRLRHITGYSLDELTEKTLHDVIHRDDVDGLEIQLEVMRSGGADSCRVEQRLTKKDGSIAWVITNIGCVRRPSGGIAYYVVGVEDVSQLKQIERRQRTLLHELSHRGKNLLAVIRTIASRTLTGDVSLAEGREVLMGRLQALAKTYETLTDMPADRVLLDAMLRSELKSFGGRVRYDGPTIILGEKATQTVALLAHELATNAAKYGALSVPDGKVSISWRLDGETPDRPLLSLHWDEEGGPPAEPPKRRGFGTVLITQVVGADFGCEPQIDFNEKRFRYRFTAPLSRIGAAATDSPVRRKLRSPIVCSLFDTWSQQRPALGLPRFASFDWSRFSATGHLTIANVEPGGDLHFSQIGKALRTRLGRHGQSLDEEDFKTVMEAYRRCARNTEPCHEFMSIDFDDGDPVTLERLLLPFSATGGRTPSHIVGIVVLDGNTQSGHQE